MKSRQLAVCLEGIVLPEHCDAVPIEGGINYTNNRQNSSLFYLFKLSTFRLLRSKLSVFSSVAKSNKNGMGSFSEITAHNSLFELIFRWGPVPISKPPKTENLGPQVALSSGQGVAFRILCGEKEGRLFSPQPSSWWELRKKRNKKRYRDGDCMKAKKWWSLGDSNSRPHPCEGCVLTNWTKRPHEKL